MKLNHGLLFGAVAVILAAAFTVTACNDGGGDDAPKVTGVTVTAAAESVATGATLQFTAAVTGENNPAQTVVWSITTSGIASGTSISPAGLLTVTAAETKTAIEVKATSTADASKSGTKTVAVTGGGSENPGGGGNFVAVTDITGVPTAATALTPLVLTGTVTPDNATNQTIAWSVKTAGTTGAAISGNTLTATGAGTVEVTATIANGATSTTAFTKDFSITVTTRVNGGEFTSIAALSEWLARQPDNTAETYYEAALTGFNVIALNSDYDPLRRLFNALNGKYVSIDLSGLSGTEIPSGYYNTSRPNKDKLVSVSLPAHLTSIGYHAFYGCTSLASVTIPAGVASIGSSAFSDCTSLASVTIPSSVASIGSYAFSGCASLASVTIPSSVTTIGSSAFGGCSSLASVTIPSSVTTIGSYAFSGCRSLASVTIPEGVTTIEDYAFENCASLASVTIPASVASIGANPFLGCASLTFTITGSGTYSASSDGKMLLGGSGTTLIAYPSANGAVTIPEGVTTIRSSAFRGCRSLASVTIPSSVASIERGTFSDCTSLASVTIPAGVASIGDYAFGGCSSLASVTIPEGVTTIGVEAFRGCTSLASVTIPEGVTTIRQDTFSGCTSLASVTIPASVTSIEKSAFENCTSLLAVICNAVTPPSLRSNVFSNNSAERYFEVPAASVSAYRSAEIWRDYASRITAQ